MRPQWETQRDVLTFVVSRAAEGRAVTVDDLVREFSVSREAACGRLTRLWGERLIEAVAARPPRFRFRPEPGEDFHALHFRLSGRGRQRLRWYERHDEGRGEGWLGLR